MYCIRCGNKVLDSDKYCERCGCCINNDCKVNEYSKSKEKNWSLIFGIIACCLFFIPVVSFPLAILAIVFGVKDRVKFNNIGIILGSISVILSILEIVFVVLIFNNLFDYLDNYDVMDNYIDQWFVIEERQEQLECDIDNKIFLVSDGSFIDFSNGSYNWYYEGNNLNYNRGSYEFYVGSEAYSYIRNELGKELAYDEDFCLIVMRPTEIMVDGVVMNEVNTVYYYGDIDREDEELELVNYNTSKSLSLVLYDKNSGVGV